jgi:ubiquinone/menaquinone biosynthesis C-methylase UbiE
MDPNCNAEYWNSGLEWHEKDIVVHKQEIFKALPLKRDDIVADVGAGTGAFEKGLSEIVGPSGKVFAIEIAPAFIPYMKNRFAKENLKNIEVINGKEDRTTLPKDSVNMVFVVDTYHHFDEGKKMVKDFHKILRDKGHLVIVDFRTGPDARPWVNEHVGITREQIIKEVTDGGFEFIREEIIPFFESFQLTFQKK